ncbi:Uncharacterized protein PCOAH_00037260 [Plasmodium coatneyi]|uniref:Ring-exported protein 3 n=1 Tax=Plasmodium coatneyi TaxID=208452 RepID=A0A1B1E5I3_9APIC|nr:Uncharacterized protein PCOAH_00037260 [Plasmodium coatneyi]ANQ10255.1 Uncharacterized protein PCOAH_00037260 [Plasmodium coatneyi]
MSRSSSGVFIFILSIIGNEYDAFFSSPSRSCARNLSEKPSNGEKNTIVGSPLEEESTREHGNSANFRGSSSGSNNAELPYSSGTVSNSMYTERFGLEDKLKKEWNDLSLIEIENWYHVMAGAVDTLSTEYESSSNTVDDKGNSWSELIKMLTAFRQAEVKENNAIFAKFVDYLRENRQNEPSNTLSEEEQNIWNEIKQLKQEKDAMWKKYHTETWKYWFQKEFPTKKQFYGESRKQNCQGKNCSAENKRINGAWNDKHFINEEMRVGRRKECVLNA